MPEQQFSTLIPWMMEKYGKNVYTIAADYNFGQISAEWTRKIVKENGGEIVGEEFIPLGVSQFGQTIQNIQKAKPDWVMTLLVGTSQILVLRAGALLPTSTCRWASSINVGLGFEHKRFKPPALKNMHVDRPTSSRSSTMPEEQGVRRQLARQIPQRALRQRHGRKTPISRVYLYKQMVERRNRPSARTSER